MSETTTLPAADFQALPLELLIASPLIAVVNAQKATAETTRSFITSFLTKVPSSGGTDSTDRFVPQTVNFDLNVQNQASDGSIIAQTVKMDVPLLSMVPVPHLRIDSVTTHFKYEVTQIVKSTSETAKQVAGEASLGLKIIPFLNMSLKGSLSSRAAEESSTNRSGMLEITVHASEAPMPEGLARLLSLMAKMAEPKV